MSWHDLLDGDPTVENGMAALRGWYDDLDVDCDDTDDLVLTYRLVNQNGTPYGKPLVISLLWKNGKLCLYRHWLVNQNIVDCDASGRIQLHDE